MQRSVYERQTTEQIEIQRKLMQGDARICSANFGNAWRGIFKRKSAEELAARTGSALRTAAYELSGEHPPSAQSIAALVNLCVPPWK